MKLALFIAIVIFIPMMWSLNVIYVQNTEYFSFYKTYFSSQPINSPESIKAQSDFIASKMNTPEVRANFEDKVFMYREKHFKKKTAESKASEKLILVGSASYYSDYFEGLTAADGSIFHQSKFTIACNCLRRGTSVRIKCIDKKGGETFATVTDKGNFDLYRCTYENCRCIRIADLSKAVYNTIAPAGNYMGTIHVEIFVIR